MEKHDQAVNEQAALESLVKVFDPGELKSQLILEQERRQLLQKFIQENLTEGVDYGRIHIASKEKCPTPWNCKIESHFSKPCLFKPGAEKFCSLLQLRAEFEADRETLEMIGNTSGLVAFRCKLIQMSTGAVVAEGRGACSVSEKGGLVNTTVKMAEKRAHVDAVLRLGLSDSFTQDLEEMKDLPEALNQTGDLSPKASHKQLEDIRFFAFVKKVDMKNIRSYSLKHFKAPFEKMSGNQAEQVMNMLEKKYGKLEEVEV